VARGASISPAVMHLGNYGLAAAVYEAGGEVRRPEKRRP